jgi:G:T/U-mismatch repair DNA glycosylase
MAPKRKQDVLIKQQQVTTALEATCCTPIAKQSNSKRKKPLSKTSVITYSIPPILPDPGPYCAPFPNKYRCRFKGTCDTCFNLSVDCTHVTEGRLKILLVGHNPSTHVWANGWAYGNPTNRMWKLLTGELGKATSDGILPKGLPFESQNRMPQDYGVGLTSIALVPGNDANKLSKRYMQAWFKHFYHRLASHRERVRQLEGHNGYKGPSIIAFEGKRQFHILFDQEPKNLAYGSLPDNIAYPSNWPFKREDSQIWILPSASGRAALSHAERLGPYAALAAACKKL